MTKLNEKLLPDDYPVYGDYLYVADGKVIRSDYHDVNIKYLKAKLDAKEITNCDIYGRRALAKQENSN